ncbi:MAG: hypothetical protein IKT55_03745 [Clostridia bacterium]|nr:hypothetical protein [Clostridia bacterium]
MADKKTFGTNDLNHIKEAICVDTNRVYDSCADKDCLTDLRVYLTDCNQNILESATSVRPRCAQILNCVIEVERVPFNKGCYSVDLTFFVKVTLDALTCPTSPPATIEGLVTFNKKCILYGSDGNVKIFTSSYVSNGNDEQMPVTNSNPKAKVQCVDPIVLDAKICRICDCCNTLGDCCDCVPRNICCCFDGSFGNYGEKAIKVTLGVFTIIQLERDVQMLIPAYDFCVPTKECCCDTEDPCDTFRRISFPIDEFFPPNSNDSNCGCSCSYTPNNNCGCGK